MMTLPFVSRKKYDKLKEDYRWLVEHWDETIYAVEKAKNVIHCENATLKNLTFNDNTVLLCNKTAIMECSFRGTKKDEPILDIRDGVQRGGDTDD